MSQLAFNLEFRPARGREDFFVTPCNAEAVGWVDRWPDWGVPGIVVYGPPASGKSHLAEVWASRSRAVSRSLGALAAAPPPAILGDALHVCLDLGDGTQLPGDVEEPLLHLYNLVVEQGGSLMFTARTPPARATIGLADLASRLRALPAVAIALPDDALLTAILLKQLEDRQISLPRDAVTYAVSRMERSFDAVRRLVTTLDREAYAQRRRPGLPLLREILDETPS
ncbi:MAG: DnaA/Hda family protein [Alphaproteobacteria bacterium]|jgi:chromosomal replication initiation ATPase DnaA